MKQSVMEKLVLDAHDIVQELCRHDDEMTGKARSLAFHLKGFMEGFKEDIENDNRTSDERASWEQHLKGGLEDHVGGYR